MTNRKSIECLRAPELPLLPEVLLPDVLNVPDSE